MTSLVEMQRLIRLEGVLPEILTKEGSARKLMNFVIHRIDETDLESENIDLFDPDDFIVVSGPLAQNRFGLYRGIVTGYKPREDVLDVWYLNLDGDFWEDHINLEHLDEIKYKWGVVQKDKQNS